MPETGEPETQVWETTVAVSDTAVSAGFEDVGVTDPTALSARRLL